MSSQQASSFNWAGAQLGASQWGCHHTTGWEQANWWMKLSQQLEQNIVDGTRPLCRQDQGKAETCQAGWGRQGSQPRGWEPLFWFFQNKLSSYAYLEKWGKSHNWKAILTEKQLSWEMCKWTIQVNFPSLIRRGCSCIYSASATLVCSCHLVVSRSEEENSCCHQARKD